MITSNMQFFGFSSALSFHFECVSKDTTLFITRDIVVIILQRQHFLGKVFISKTCLLFVLRNIRGQESNLSRRR